jgi:tetratricopeptide (TPR) repeat protein
MHIKVFDKLRHHAISFLRSRFRIQFFSVPVRLHLATAKEQDQRINQRDGLLPHEDLGVLDLALLLQVVAHSSQGMELLQHVVHDAEPLWIGLQAETMMDTQKYSKAKQLYDQLLDIDPNDAGAQLMMGVVQGLMKAKKESETALAKAKSILSEKKAGRAAEELTLLKYALTMHATNLAGSSKTAAKEWLDLGLEYFPDDKEYKVTYDTIVG